MDYFEKKKQNSTNLRDIMVLYIIYGITYYS